MKIETYFKIRFYNLNVSPKHFCGHSYNFSTKLLRITMIRLTKIYSNSRVIPVGDFGEGSVYRCGYKNYLVRYNNIVTISTIAQGTSIDTSLCCLPLGLLGYSMEVYTLTAITNCYINCISQIEKQSQSAWFFHSAIKPRLRETLGEKMK